MKCIKSLVSTLLFFCLIFSFSKECAADQFEHIRNTIRQRIARQDVPSVCVAAARGNLILWEECFGWADLENRIPATPQTPFTLGSVSKPITATAIMLLFERGLINLDRPINDYLGRSKLAARIGTVAEATLRRVANHTAGLPGYYETFYRDEPGRPPTMEEVIHRYGIIVFPPGERFHYSNLDYGLLGHIISRASGKDYARFMREDILRPLGMAHSFVTIPRGLRRYRAIRYLPQGRRLPDYVTPHPAAADLYASVHDLIRFGLFHINSNLPGQKRLLSEMSKWEMQKPTVSMNESDSYGIGWVISKDGKGRRRVSHGGAGAGVDAQLTLMPDEKLAVAVLANSFAEPRIAGGVADAILDTLLGDDPKDRKSAAIGNFLSSLTKKPSLPGILLGKWIGVIRTYKGEVPVTLWFEEAGNVHAQIGNQLKMQVSDARLEKERFTGRMTGDIGTPDASRRAHHLAWDITVRGDYLNGVLYVVGTPQSRGVFLPNWVELRKSP